MSYGFVIKNSSGDVLIDGETPMMHLIYEADVSVSRGGSVTLSIPACNNKPLVLLSPHGQYSFMWYRVWKSSSLWDRVTVYCTSNPNYPSTHTAKVFVFSQAELPSSEAYGIRVYNSSGQIVFSSEAKMLRRLLYASGTLSGGQTASVPFGEQLSYIPAVGFTDRRVQVGGIPGYFLAYHGIFVNVATDRVYLKCDVYGAYGFNISWAPSPSLQVQYGLFVFKYK